MRNQYEVIVDEVITRRHVIQIESDDTRDQQAHEDRIAEAMKKVAASNVPLTEVTIVTPVSIVWLNQPEKDELLARGQEG